MTVSRMETACRPGDTKSPLLHQTTIAPNQCDERSPETDQSSSPDRTCRHSKSVQPNISLITECKKTRDIKQHTRQLGCVHIDTSASPSTRVRVPANTSLHVFQWRPFTLNLIRVLYEYGLPVNFTRKRSFCARHVIQPV